MCKRFRVRRAHIEVSRATNVAQQAVWHDPELHDVVGNSELSEQRSRGIRAIRPRIGPGNQLAREEQSYSPGEETPLDQRDGSEQCLEVGIVVVIPQEKKWERAGFE